MSVTVDRDDVDLVIDALHTIGDQLKRMNDNEDRRFKKALEVDELNRKQNDTLLAKNDEMVTWLQDHFRRQNRQQEWADKKVDPSEALARGFSITNRQMTGDISSDIDEAIKETSDTRAARKWTDRLKEKIAPRVDDS